MKEILKNCNLTFDGIGYAGQVEEMTLPALSIQTEEFRAGGMDAPIKIDMGMEALEFSFNLLSFSQHVLSNFGIGAGREVQITARGALQSNDGAVKAAVAKMTGKIEKIDPGSWKPGEKASLNVTMTLTYYKLEIGGFPVHEIDIPNMIRMINGIDQLEKIRAAIGM